MILQAKNQSTAGLDINFIAPDRLIAEQQAADILIIDEAAMLPYPMLQQLCRQYRKIIMATTTGGYEGTGQGVPAAFYRAPAKSAAATTEINPAGSLGLGRLSRSLVRVHAVTKASMRFHTYGCR